MTCERCGTRWTGEQPCPDCRRLRVAERIAAGSDESLALRMIQAAVWMKRQYQDAGLIVARVFCETKGLNADALEREIRLVGQL